MTNQIFTVCVIGFLTLGCGRSDEPSSDASKTLPDAPRSVVFDLAADRAQSRADAVNEAAKAWDKLMGMVFSDDALMKELSMDRDGFTDRFYQFQIERRKADGRSVRELLAAVGYKPIVIDALLK